MPAAFAAKAGLFFSWNGEKRLAAVGTTYCDWAWLLRPRSSAFGAKPTGSKYVAFAGWALPERQLMRAMGAIFLGFSLFLLAQKPPVCQRTDDSPAQHSEEKILPVDFLFPSSIKQDAHIGKVGNQYDGKRPKPSEGCISCTV